METLNNLLTIDNSEYDSCCICLEQEKKQQIYCHSHWFHKACLFKNFCKTKCILCPYCRISNVKLINSITEIDLFDTISKCNVTFFKVTNEFQEWEKIQKGTAIFFTSGKKMHTFRVFYILEIKDNYFVVQPSLKATNILKFDTRLQFFISKYYSVEKNMQIKFM